MFPIISISSPRQRSHYLLLPSRTQRLPPMTRALRTTSTWNCSCASSKWIPGSHGLGYCPSSHDIALILSLLSAFLQGSNQELTANPENSKGVVLCCPSLALLMPNQCNCTGLKEQLCHFCMMLLWVSTPQVLGGTHPLDAEGRDPPSPRHASCHNC